jgi:hypothetical protein
MVTTRWMGALAVLLVSLVSGVLLIGQGHAEGRKQIAQAECGTPYNDWVCRERGRITLWRGDSQASVGAALRQRQRVMPRFTKVRAETGAEGSVRFRNKASCDLGPAGGPTEIVTRVDRESLFQQTLGNTACRSLDGSFAPVGFFCEATGPCPVLFLSKGRYELSGPRFGGAHASSTSYLRVVIDACTEVFEVKIQGRDKPVRREAAEPTQYHIVIVQKSEVTENGSGQSWSMHLKSVAAPGICDEP